MKAVRAGQSLRAVAREFRVSLATVQRWVRRAGSRALDEVDWSERASGCQAPCNRTSRRLEERVLRTRKRLKDRSDLGEYGAAAIQRELLASDPAQVPSLRTIGRILDRNGALDGRRRLRRKAPPPGWYLPDVAARQAEIDSFDMVEDLVIRGGRDVNVLTGISLHGALCAAWPRRQITAKFTVESLLEHWREHGLPRYAKFDNDTVFQGAHQWADSFGRVTRLCLSLDVTPIFAPPLSRGFQADIEAFNRRWQDAVWRRFTFRKLEDVQAQSERFVDAHRRKHVDRIDAAPLRHRIHKTWRLDLQRPLQGQVIYLRVTDGRGRVNVVGRSFEVSPLWSNRLVRVDLDLTQGQVRVHRLRRREPDDQPLLATHDYSVPRKRFQD